MGSTYAQRTTRRCSYAGSTKKLCNEFQYGHVTTDDFIQHCETVSGMELGGSLINGYMTSAILSTSTILFRSHQLKGGVILSQVQSDTNLVERSI